MRTIITIVECIGGMLSYICPLAGIAFLSICVVLRFIEHFDY